MRPTSPSPGPIFRCEQCGRHTWDALFACPQRRDGACPFLLENVGGSRLTRLVAAAACWALVLGALRLTRQAGDDLTRLVVVLIALVLGVAGSLAVLSLFSEPSYLLVNRATGAVWHRLTLAGWTISDQITLPIEPLPINLSLGFTPTYPASVSTLCQPGSSVQGGNDRQMAIDIVLHTLIALIARGLLAVRVSRRYTRYWGRPLKLDSVKYALEPGPLAELTEIDGELEGRLMVEAIQWLERTPENALSIQRLAASWQIPPDQGVEVDKLVAAIFDDNQHDPYEWLVMLVEEDTIARGLCNTPPRRAGGRAAYDIAPAHAGWMAEESQAVRAAQTRLARAHPDLVRALRYAIDVGIEARQEA